ncbi:MAG: hypothetical protein EBR65_01625 [Actinobacteria bacterium]|nr:hypothetical protein [Actinomycetota bacterium]
MAWDSSRPVPWGRLIREWLVYVVVMLVVLVVVIDGADRLGAVAGLLVSGPLYVAFGAVLAKFGYKRERLRRARPAVADPEPEPIRRPRPAPTKRTGGGRPRR